MLDREHWEHKVYLHLMQMIPGLKEHLINGTDEYILHIAELLRSFRPYQYIFDYCSILPDPERFI